MEAQQKGAKSVNLNDLEEGLEGESKQEEGARQLLQGFLDANVKIHLLADQDITALNTKKRYQGLFDIGVLSINSANKISKDFTALFKHEAKVHVESADYIIVLKEDQRVEYRAKVIEKLAEADWTFEE